MQIACTQCSAKLAVKEDDQFLLCEYCSSALFIDGGKGADCWLVKPLLDEQGACEKAATLLMDMGAKSEELMATSHRLLVPFREEAKEGKTKITLAAELVVSLDGLRTLQGEREPYSDNMLSDWDKLPPLEDEQELAETTRQLIQYPMFRIDYLYGGNEFVMFIDGVTGNAFADDIPTFAALEHNFSFFIVLLMSFCTYVAIFHLIPGSLAFRSLILLPAFIVFSIVTARIVVNER